MGHPIRARGRVSPAQAPIGHRVVAAILAVVFPALILAGAYVGLTQLRSNSDLREDRNAGFVLNGKPVKGGVVRAIERAMTAEPEVIILGNSLSNTDLLPSLLAQRLGIPKSKVQKFSIPNSLGSHWYVVLKNRVYANGHQPRLVILLSDMQSQLAIHPRTEPSYVNLSVQLDREGGEPILDKKMGRRNWAATYFWDQIREEREDLRDTMLKSARNLIVDIVHGSRGSATSHAATSKALDRVFADDRTDMLLHHSVIPVMSGERELVPFDPADLPRPKDSLIPDICDIVSENGGKAVFLRPPMSPLLPPEAGDLVTQGTEGRVYALAKAHGGIYLDMRSFEMADGLFHNVDHMNPAGARRFTEAVAQILNQIEPPKKLKGRVEREAELFTAFDLAGSRVASREIRADFRDEPPAIQRPIEPARGAARPRAAYVDVPNWASLSDSATIEVTPFAAACSPLRITEDGQRLPSHNVPCEETFKHGKGRVCHPGDRLWLAASDDSNPADNGRAYSLEFTETRWCEGGLWLYPNDRARLAWQPADLGRLERGGRFLQVTAHDMGGRTPGASQLAVRMKVASHVPIDATLTVPPGTNGTDTWAVSPVVPPDAPQVMLELTNLSDRFLLVTSARLTERRPTTETADLEE